MRQNKLEGISEGLKIHKCPSEHTRTWFSAGQKGASWEVKARGGRKGALLEPSESFGAAGLGTLNKVLSL